MADIYRSLSEPQQAIDFYNQALEIQRRVNDRRQQANTVYKIADVYSSLGDYPLSIETYTQALEISTSVGDRTSIGLTLDRIGSVYRLAKEYPKALEFHNHALSRAREQDDSLREIGALSSISRDYEDSGNYAKARDTINQALVVSRKHKHSFGEAAALGQMSRVSLAAGEYQQALDVATQSLALIRKLTMPASEANVLGIMGKIYKGLQQPQQAIDTYTQALAIWRQLGDRTGEADTLYQVALIERERGNWHASRTHIENVLTIVEDIRTKVTSQDLRTTYLASVQQYYAFYIDTLMQLHKQHPSQGYDVLALHASERTRARSLLDLLIEARADIRTGVTPELLARERTLQQKLDTAEKRRLEVAQTNATQAHGFAKEITALLEEYRQLQAHMRTTSPRYAALTQPQPLTLAEIQQQVVDEETMLLQYALGEERSYLWAVTPTGMHSYELSKRDAIETAALQFYTLLRTPAPRLDLARGLQEGRDGSTRHASLGREAANNLSQMLLQPVAEQLGDKRLLIVSDGALQYVPFAALPRPQPRQSTATSRSPLGQRGKEVEPLLVQHEIVHLPSASTLGILRKQHTERTTTPQALGRSAPAPRIAVFADPIFSRDDERLGAMGRQVSHRPVETRTLDQRTLARATRATEVTLNRLPFTRQEAEQILALVPATHQLPALDFAASRAAVTSSDLSQYHIVHFATHGILNSTQPELSGVVLSLVDEQGTPQNGFLRLHDIFNLHLPAGLVVLSACETGLGEVVKGEGLIGLTRGFMYAGSPRVVVSLWSVDDEGNLAVNGEILQKNAARWT